MPSSTKACVTVAIDTTTPRKRRQQQQPPGSVLDNRTIEYPGDGCALPRDLAANHYLQGTCPFCRALTMSAESPDPMVRGGARHCAGCFRMFSPVYDVSRAAAAFVAGYQRAWWQAVYDLRRRAGFDKLVCE